MAWNSDISQSIKSIESLTVGIQEFVKSHCEWLQRDCKLVDVMAYIHMEDLRIQLESYLPLFRRHEYVRLVELRVKDLLLLEMGPFH